VVLAAFSGNVDEAVRTEKRPSITAPVHVVKDIFRRCFSSPQPVLAPFPILMYKRGGSGGTGLPVSAAAHQKVGGYYGEYSESTIGEFRLLQG
jgi:hypothetical protein